MYNFKVDSLRSATDGTHNARVMAANDLVQRTLAQHGLVSPLSGAVDGQAGAVPSSVPPVVVNPMAGFKTPFTGAAAQHVVIPEGAEFRQEQFSCEAGSRSYRTYIPSSATIGVTGIVVMLHGCTQNPEDFALGTGMNQLAEKHRFVVIYPQQSRGDNAQSCWNWFSRGDQHRDRGEPAILAGMTRKVMAEQGVPKEKTCVAGLSAGAAMAVILGETYPDVFCAVGAHSGLPLGVARDVPSAFAAMAGNANMPEAANRVSEAPAVRTIVFHGSADATVHPSNGDGIARHIRARGAQLTIETDEQGRTSGRSFSRKIIATAQGTTELEHWVVDGLGHAWSGGQPEGSYTDTQGPDASAEMVRFFFESGNHKG
ncbi:alpha/beta hydrolase family esterase [Granulosicoccus antarcticus]|uniref:Esterase n=1 Tax=Granulosicoccus antarcticus IMCC3135 TaxID=1192854 RepID=A0A2Z2NW08_9GAMM|nr:PHB depolymerase family esterase [Granulosicoccus antarcticus]ASJ72980.1 hypothetical protein IMCC3135_14475 [Granulosicoccus antarcticus IMCC3135]